MIFQTNVRFCKTKKMLDSRICHFQSCLETNSSGIGIARGPTCSICKDCSNFFHSIEADNSNIALEEKQLLLNFLRQCLNCPNQYSGQDWNKLCKLVMTGLLLFQFQMNQKTNNESYNRNFFIT